MPRTLPHVENGLYRFMATITGVGAVMSVYAVLQYFGVDPLSLSAEGFEAELCFATTGNLVMLGGFLAFTLPVALYMLFSSRDITVSLMAIASCLIGLGIFATASRGAWIAAFFGATILFFLLIRQEKVPVQRVLPSALALLSAGAVFIALSSIRAGTANLFDRAQLLIDFASGSGASRIEIWRSALGMIADRPVFGFGPDNFRYAFPGYETAMHIKTSGYETIADNAHNFLLNLAAQQGIVSVLCFFTVIVSTIAVALSHARASREDRRLYIGLVAGFVSF